MVPPGPAHPSEDHPYDHFSRSRNAHFLPKARIKDGRLDGFLVQSLNDKTFLFPVILLDKTVSLGYERLCITTLVRSCYTRKEEASHQTERRQKLVGLASFKFILTLECRADEIRSDSRCDVRLVKWREKGEGDAKRTSFLSDFRQKPWQRFG